MDDNTAKVLLAVVPATISAFVTWHLTKTSERAQRSQRWLERKAAAYTDAVEALSIVEASLSESLMDVEFSTSLVEPHKTEDARRYRTALEKLAIAANSGEFLLTNEASHELRRVLGRVVSIGAPVVDDLEAGLQATREGL